MLTYKTTSEAYLDALHNVWNNYQFRSAPRGLPVRETLNYSFMVLHPTAENIITLDEERNKVIADYTAKETQLYDSCTNLASDFTKASKFWEKLANPDGTVNSAYGYLIWKNKSHGNPVFEGDKYPIEDVRTNPKIFDNIIRTPWEWCVHSLKQDKDTRQAILRFSLPEHQWDGNKDQTCTMHGNLLIRDDKLHFTIVMRSNDLMKGLVYDLPWFVSLMDKMVAELKPLYPDLEVGTYTHIVHSMHIYEKDEAHILKMLGK
jgi:thymidylate synthase